MSGDIIVSDSRVAEQFDFSEEIGARSPGWYRAECLVCDTYSTGTEPAVVEWAYAHECPVGSLLEDEGY